MKWLLTFLLLLCFLTHGINLCAQQSVEKFDPVSIAHAYINSHLDEWGLSTQDVSGMTISDMYTDKVTGITRIYYLQNHNGIPVHNAILNINITKEGKVFFAGNRFEPNLAERINTTIPVINPEDAVMNLTSHLALPGEQFRLISKSGESQFVFEKGNVAQEDIKVMLAYQPYQGKVHLAWDIFLAPAINHDSWSTRVDAVTGAVLDEYNWTSYCHANDKSYFAEDDDCEESHSEKDNTASQKKNDLPIAPLMSGEQYNVWPAPMESPNDGPRTMITNPYDPIASPYGWHDTNGQPGAEYTITRGNNVWAYKDRDNIGYSSGDEPNGGPELHFDFPFDPTSEPDQYSDASVVNLFYWINYMHDFMYRFGFDENAGNFQKNNYGKGGIGNDFMWGVAQCGANTGLKNNASYTHRPDGSGSSIFMYEFHPVTACLTVNEPAAIRGRYRTIMPAAGWGDGSYLTDEPITGEVVLVDDGVELPSASDGCEDFINASEIAGKIALIDRGGCQFAHKALKAQEAGAIAAVFCNYENNSGNLSPGAGAADVHIPILLINVRDCKTLRQYSGQGIIVTLVNPDHSDSLILDSDLQNSTIAHEYGHGVSNRIAGGPDVVCLKNAERMNEGWSDYFALVTTVKPGDTGEKKRGMSTYLMRESSYENGFRRHPFSTDMSISPLTYGDVSYSQQVHDIGEVWANVLWDMYWSLSDKYGWSPDPYDPSSGNYKAVRLVIEGLKNLPCNAGFVDGRDAILAADEVINNGDNICLLWEVFARRGLGFSADQGSPFDAGDQKEAFDVAPFCSGKIFIDKSVTDFIQPGEEIEVVINVSNYKNETSTNVIVSDVLPAGTSFKPNSSNLPASLQGNTVLFNLGDMDPNEQSTIQYVLTTDPLNWSQRNFFDEIVDEEGINWLTYVIGPIAPNNWSVTDSLPAHSGNYSWMTNEIQLKSQQALVINTDINTIHVEGEHPALRFYHRYNTKAGQNGGIVEVREAGDYAWSRVDDVLLRNGYPGMIDYRTFVSPAVKAFSGNNGEEYKATYVDLSDWLNKDIEVRFRFGTTGDTSIGFGWQVDDIELMDLLSYNGEACVTSDQGDYECTIAPEAGTIVESREDPVSGTEELNGLSVSVYPNPAIDVINIGFVAEHAQDITLNMMTIDGKLLFSQTFNAFGTEFIKIDTHNVPPGLYIVKLDTAEGTHSSKIIIQE